MSASVSRAASACLLIALSVYPAAGQNTLQARRDSLNRLLEEQWQYALRISPITASFYGDKRWNDQLGDFSRAAVDRDLVEAQKFLARFEAIDTSGFPEQEALNKTLIVRDLKEHLEGARFRDWEMPVDQQNGIQIALPEIVNVLSFQNAKDYEDFLSRLHQIPRVLDEITANMRRGLLDGLVPPRFLLTAALAQSHSVATQAPEQSSFFRPFQKIPDVIPTADRTRLRGQGLAAVRDLVLPAYQKFTAFLRDEYVPKGRVEPGVWALPDGPARYAFQVKRMTTTDQTPEQIHALGLAQVDAIEKQMIALAHQLGFQDLAGLNARIKADHKFYGTSARQMLDLYGGYVSGMQPLLPQLFGRLPKNKLEVIPMEASRSEHAVPADYTEGTADGSRPGHINVNEWDPEHRLLLNVEAIAYHEGNPGHHLQISIAQELPELHPFRQHEQYTAFVEGWALYSERLGEEVGRYQDPYSDYGRLENEMWRAIRLVVDTGVHDKHWSREQMVSYFHRYTAMDEPNIQTEVDRYIAWPGQALAYELGQQAILRLREYAKTRLGSRFDIRAFHDEVLGSGALPLDVLEAHVRAWVDSQVQP